VYSATRKGAKAVDRSGHRRPFRSGVAQWVRLLIALSVVLGVVVVPDPAWAALPSEKPDTTWHLNGPAWAIVKAGDTIYIGGQFTQLRENPLNEEGGQVKNVSNLAAIDATTGAPAPGVEVPKFTGTGSIVYALTVVDGRLWIGGRFTSADDKKRTNIATIDPETGALMNFNPEPNPRVTGGIVWALADDGSKVFAGGKFTKVNGQTRNRLAAFSLDGTLDPNWTPSANNKVADMAVTPDGTGIFITGLFSSVSNPGGGSQERNKIARLSTATGTVHPWVAKGLTISSGVIGMGVNAIGDRVYWAVGGPDWVAALNINTGARLWKTETDGTVDDAVELGDRVIIGGHFVLVGPQPGGAGCATHPEECVRHVRLAALSKDGVLDQSWDPKLHGPKFNGVIEWEGVREFLVVGDKLWIVGEFFKVTDVWQSYFARLS
jgi:outer membrane protein assembly factor BamB